MEIFIYQNSVEAQQQAARCVAQLVRRKPDAVLGLPTGSTPIPLYRELSRMHREDGLDFSAVTTFNMDEYVGIPHDHPGSFHAFMNKHFFSQVNITPGSIHIPDGQAGDLPGECRDYEQKIVRAGGIDVMILGLGLDGHIAFNEPASSLASRTRIKALTEGTRRDNAADFGGLDQVPQHVITIGIGTILDSRQCLLVALGEKKAAIVAKVVEGPVTAMVPASALQLHSCTALVLDSASAQCLERKDAYRYQQQFRPVSSPW